MKLEAWTIKLGDVKVYAILLYFQMAHRPVFKLMGNIGPFKEGTEVTINLNTLEMETIRQLRKVA